MTFAIALYLMGSNLYCIMITEADLESCNNFLEPLLSHQHEVLQVE